MRRLQELRAAYASDKERIDLPPQGEWTYEDYTQLPNDGWKYIVGVPDLVVEIISPSNWVDDRRVKFGIYAEAGILEYWIVDPRQETIDVFILGQQSQYELLDRFGAGDSVRSHVPNGFAFPVQKVFAQ
jgi:Uma2 family endonuclease